MTVTAQTPAPPTSAGGDVTRQIVVATSALVAIAGLAIGAGGFGGEETQDAAGGAFAATATLIAPAGPAFSIWSVIYLGLLALGVWQALPAQRSNPRLRQVGWLVAFTMLANTAWILVVQAGLVWASVAVIVALLVALVLTYVRLLGSTPSGRAEKILLDGTMGLYLGWVSVATAANIAAAAVDNGWSPSSAVATALTVTVIVVVAVVGALVGWVGRGRWAFSVALGWGLVWVCVGRWSGAPQDTTVAVSALIAAAVVLVTPAIAHRR